MKIATLWAHEKTKEENTRLTFLPRNWTNGTLPKSFVEYEYEEELFCYEYTSENQEIHINIKFRSVKDLYTIRDVEHPDIKTGKGMRRAPNPSNVTDQLYWFLQPPQDPSGVVLNPTNEQVNN